MIVCPNCNHTNPEGATQCEACYTALPEMIPCPNCGLSVQTDAVFCGQCGYNLQSVASDDSEQAEILPTQISASPDSLDEPDNLTSDVPSHWEQEEVLPSNELEETQENAPISPPIAELPTPEPEPDPIVVPPSPEPIAEVTPPTPEPIAEVTPPTPEPIAEVTPPTPEPTPTPDPLPTPSVPKAMATQLQVQTASLLHVQTQTTIDLPNNLDVIHIGKPNEQIPPDIDVSGFNNSEVVSRVHADIRVEGDTYYLEDVGSSNGTYVNHNPLPSGNRHCLRPGDRISLGKGDLVTFIFQR